MRCRYIILPEAQGKQILITAAITENRTEDKMDYRELVRRECPDMEPIVCETAAETFFRKELLAKGPDPDRKYSIEDFRALPEGLRAELVDGKLIYLEAPTRLHQEIAGEMYLAVANHIKSKGGKCKVYIPPFDVYISGDHSRVLEPDLTVVCDRDKLNKRGCTGAPDWVVEVTSPSARKRDLGKSCFYTGRRESVNTGSSIPRTGRPLSMLLKLKRTQPSIRLTMRFPAAFSLISKSACRMWCNRGFLPQGTAGGSEAKSITQPDRAVAHGRFIAEEFLPDPDFPSGTLGTGSCFGDAAAFLPGKGKSSCAGGESSAGVGCDGQDPAVVISGDGCKVYFRDRGHLTGDCADGVSHIGVRRKNRLCAQHFRDPRQEDMGGCADADQLCMCFKNTGQETAAAPAFAGEFPGMIDEVIHLPVKGGFGERRTFRNQEDADDVFVEPFRDKIICLLGEGFGVFRFTAADEKGGGMPGCFRGKGSKVTPDMHEIRGSETASQDDPGGLQTAEVGGVNIFSHSRAGILIGERTFFQRAAQSPLTPVKAA